MREVTEKTLPRSAASGRWEGSRKAPPTSEHLLQPKHLELARRDIWWEHPVEVKEKSLFFSPEPWADTPPTQSAVSSHNSVSPEESLRKGGEGLKGGVASATDMFALSPTVGIREGKSCSGSRGCTHGGLIQAALCLLSRTSNWQWERSVSRRQKESMASLESLPIPSQEFIGDSCWPDDCDTILPGSGQLWDHSQMTGDVLWWL